MRVATGTHRAPVGRLPRLRDNGATLPPEVTMAHPLLEAAQAIGDQLTADRRSIHQHPELAYQEERTARFVAQRLAELGLQVRAGVGGTGVVGLLRGARPGRTVLLRADMDALPMEERGEAPYVSQNPGVMHACGHDGHTAVLLGAARLLAQQRDRLPGAVKFMFQPAEEGGAGALRMIEQGLLQDPQVDAAFALHVDPLHYAGQVATRVGPTMAAADRFTLTVRGTGGHAARPHLAVDPVAVAAQVISALQTIVSREVDPAEPAVITVGSLAAGTTFNVIPDEAVLRGTARSYAPAVRDQLERRIGEVAAGIAGAMRAQVRLDYERLYPPLVNHASGVELVRRVAAEVLGPQALAERDLMMGAEDFAYVLERVPGAMFYLGVRGRDWAEPRPIHSASFDLDEGALTVGAAMMAGVALAYLAGA